ncbi:hypothetical protein C2E23DRAFT_493437 [Lenzites betulinus]|nr:hypothetical protein C2E23DRAFT_493437 [Lenzites betulinus]
MSSIRAALALVVLVPALICGATPAALPPRSASNTTENQPNTLLACIDQECTVGCITHILDGLPLNVCESLNGGSGFTSFEIISSDLDGAPFVLRLGQQGCGALSFAPLAKLNVCSPSGSTPFTEFVLEAGTTPFD